MICALRMSLAPLLYGLYCLDSSQSFYQRHFLWGFSYLLLYNHAQEESVGSSRPVKYQIASYLQCILIVYCTTHYPKVW